MSAATSRSSRRRADAPRGERTPVVMGMAERGRRIPAPGRPRLPRQPARSAQRHRAGARGVPEQGPAVRCPGCSRASSCRAARTTRPRWCSDRAVGTDQDKKFVLVLKPDSSVEYRPVQLGRLVDGYRVVKAGLKPGERIVVNGATARATRHEGDRDAPARCWRSQPGQRHRHRVVARHNNRTEEATRAFLSLLHRPPDLRGRAFDRDLPRRRWSPSCALPVSEYPEVAPPSIVVRAVYPGANPRVLAESVATPLEEQINGVENMLYMSSQATADGVLTLTVTFEIGTDVDLAQVQVQNRVSQALPRLPEEVRQLGVTTVKSSPDITMVVHLVSPDDRYDMVYLRNYALLQVKDALARIPGVGQVVVFGAGDYAMRVWLDPNKVAARGLSAGDVVAAIREQNVQVAAGVVGGTPMPEPRRLPAHRQRPRPPDQTRRSSATSSSRPAPTARSRGSATSRASSSARATTPCARCSTTRTRSRSASSRRPAPTRSALQPPCARRWPSSRRRSRRASSTASSTTRPVFVRECIARGGQDAARGDPARRARRRAVPADLARVDHSAAGGAGLDRRHVRGDARVRLLDQHAVAVRAGARRSASWSTTPSWWSKTSSATSKPGCRHATPATGR